MVGTDTLKEALSAWHHEFEVLNSTVKGFEEKGTALCTLLDPASTNLTEKELEDTYGEIDSAFGRLDEIELTLQRARRELGALRNHSLQLAPVNRLHPEILSYIFLLGQWGQELDVAQSAEDPTESELDETVIPFALIISQVSKRWRAVAIDTANLWTKIDFADGPPYHFSRILLERSKNALLNISLSLSDSDNQEEITEVMKLLVPTHSGRVSSLSIEAISLDQIGWILSQFVNDSDTTPPIRELALTEASANGELVQFTLGPGKLPTLVELTAGITKLSLDGVQLPWKSNVFHNLTHLNLESNPASEPGARPSEEQFLAILHSSPHLQSLRILDTGILMADPMKLDDYKRHPRLEMPSLKSLELEDVPWNQMLFILHVINPPNLQDLRIASPEIRLDANFEYVEDPDNVVDDSISLAVTDFIEKISTTAKIVSLDLENFTRAPLGSTRLSKMLSFIPHVRMLSLQEVDFDNDLLKQMHGVWGLHTEGGHTPNRGILCPQLRTLVLCNVESITLDAVTDMVSIRHKQGHPLHTLKLISIGVDSMPVTDLKRTLGLFVDTLIVEDDDHLY